jgi:hypothetical protein
MQKFANLASQAANAFEAKDWPLLGSLMDANFETRKNLYGQTALGGKNMQMVEIGQKHGAHCKFPGNL